MTEEEVKYIVKREESTGCLALLVMLLASFLFWGISKLDERIKKLEDAQRIEATK